MDTSPDICDGEQITGYWFQVRCELRVMNTKDSVMWTSTAI